MSKKLASLVVTLLLVLWAAPAGGLAASPVDGHGGSTGSVDSLVTVDPCSDEAPTLSTGSDFATTKDEAVRFVADLDGDAQAVSYEWRDGYGENGNGRGPGPEVLSTERSFTTQLNPGNHQITLVVETESGETLRDTLSVQVRGQGRGAERDSAPVADAGDCKMVIAEEDATLNGSGSYDRDGTIEAYEWDTDGDGEIETTGERSTVQFSELGNRTVELTVTDDGANTDTDETRLFVNDRPDVAFDRTPDRPNPEEATTFDASNASDDLGGIASYEWDFGDGTTATGETVDHAFAEPGNYTVSLTVTDRFGVSNTTEKRVHVNFPPEADANRSPGLVNVTEVFSFDGSASSDVEDGIVSYEWDVDGDGTFEKSGEFPEHAYETGEDPTVTLRVTDDGGLTDTDNISVAVNVPPEADASETPSLVNVTETFTLDASESVDDGPIQGYEWDVDGDGTFEKTGETVQHAYETGEDRTVTLRVTGDVGLTDTTNVSIEVNVPPEADASRTPDLVNVSEEFTLDASASIDDGPIQSYEWDVDGDGTFEKTGATVPHSYGDPADRTVTLRVTGDVGLTDTTTVAIEVNAPPEANLSRTPDLVNVTEEFALDGSASTDDGPITGYEWDVEGDGVFEKTGATTTHAYETAADRTVTLRVTGDVGLTDTATTTVEVNAPPEADASETPDLVNVSEEFTLDASLSTDDGTIQRYEWDLDGDGTFEKTGETVAHAFDSPDDRTVTLRVTGDVGLTDTTTVAIQVNAPPQADPGPGQRYVNVSEPLALDGSGSTDDGEIVAYEWDLDGDGEYEVTGPTAERTYDSPGDRTVRLRVTDEYGATDTATVAVDVNAPPEAGIDGGDRTLLTGETTSFGGSASSDDDGVVRYEWDLDGDGTTDATGQTIDHAYDGAGQYEVELTVVDDRGLTDSATVTVTVVPGEVADEPSGIPPGPENPNGASATGDPHITTFDGVDYDFQAAGEFVLARSPGGTLSVQGRLIPRTGRPVSVIQAVATRLDGHNVTIDAGDGSPLVVDGVRQELDSTDRLDVGTGAIFRRGSEYVVVYPGADGEVDAGDERLTVRVRGSRVDVWLTLAAERSHSVEGLLGTSPPGVPDVALANGTAVSPGDYGAMYGPFRADWRVDNINQSHFHYEDGESPESFYDPDYPAALVTTDDLPDDERSEAEEAAIAAGLEPGTPAFENAVLDYASTEDDSYLESAATSRPTNATFQVAAGEGFNATPGEPTTFVGTVRDGSTEGATFEWRFGDGTRATGREVSHAFDAPGTYTISLTVTGPEGGVTRDSTTVTVGENVTTDRPPVPDVATTRANATHARLNASGTVDPDGSVVGYSWDLDGDGTTDRQGATVTLSVETTPRTVTVVVIDEDGNRVTERVTVPGSNAAPTADAGADRTGTVGTSVAFDASGSSDPEGDALTYEWAFGDGATATGTAPSHAYDAAGTYVVTLTVTDEHGAVDTDTLVVTVEADEPLERDLIAHWTFDDPVTGEALDAAGDHDASITGATYTSGTSDPALSFDGDDYVSTEMDLSDVEAATVTIWWRSDRSVDSGSQGLWGTARDSNNNVRWEFWNGQWEFRVEGDGGTAAGIDVDGSVPAGEWHMDAVVFHPDAPPEWYRDGELVATGRGSGAFATVLTGPEPFVIGDSYQSSGTPGGHAPWHGDLDEVRLYGRALDGSGVETVYRQGRSGTGEPVVDAGEDRSANVGETVTLTADATPAPGRTVDSYEWDVDGDGTYEETGETVDHAYDAGGTYTVELRVTDDEGTVATDTAVVTVGSLTEDLVAHYRFDDANDAGTALDSAGSNHGSVNGAEYAEGVAGRAMAFDASSDHVELSEFVNFPAKSTATLGLWAAIDGDCDDGHCAFYSETRSGSTDTDFVLQYDTGDRQLDLHSNVGGIYKETSFEVPADGSWHHYVVTKNGNEYAVYVDGERVGGPWTLDFPTDGADTTYIGERSPANNYQETIGRIDDVRIYDREFSAEGARNLYTATVVPTADAGSNRTVDRGESLTFDASDSWDPADDIASYEWDLGDGTTATGRTVDHAYDATGTYSVTVTVTDEAGNARTDTVTVRVVDPDGGIPEGSLSGHWRFDDASDPSTAVDAAGTNPGAIDGGEYVDGLRDSALRFEEDPDHVELSEFVNLPAKPDATLSLWAAVTEDCDDNHCTIYSETRAGTTDVNFVLQYDDDDRLLDLHSNVGGIYKKTSFEVPADGSWHHYVVTKHDDEFAVYVDGERVGGPWTLEFPTDVADTTYIGERSPANNYQETIGRIDDVRIYDHAFSPGAVRTLHDASVAPTADAGDDRNASTGETVAFDASGSTDPTGDITGYEWDVDGDGTYETTGETVEHTYESTGTFTVELQVTDDDGNVDTDTVTVTVETVSEGLVAHYEFEGTDDASTALDSAGDADGTISGASYSTGVLGDALSFDGVDDEVTVSPPPGSLPAGDQPRTLSAWVYPTSTDPGNPVAYGDGLTANARFSILLNGGAGVIGQNNDLKYYGSVPAGEWTHVVATHDGSTTRLYVDGTEVASATRTYDTNDSMPLMIGTNTDNRDDEFLEGRIDEVRVYDRALSGGEVDELRLQTAVPRADAGPDRTATPGDGITLDASATSDAAADVQSYEWDFGDGSSATGRAVDHTYQDTGTYEVQLRVEDAAGNVDTDTITVTVKETAEWLVAHYEFEGTGDASTALDSAGDADGTISGASYARGVDGSALSFDGVDDEVTVSPPPESLPAGDQSRTLAAWVYLTSTDPGNPIAYGDGLTANARFSILLSGGEAGVVGQSNDLKYYGSVPTGEWTHVVATHDRTTTRLYVDGEQVASAPRSYDTDASMPLMIGTNTDNRDDEFVEGRVDDARVYGHGLSAAEVDELWRETAVPRADAGDDRTVEVGESITFDASGSTDPAGDVTSHEWEFGDGTTATGETVTHSYDSGGEYSVTLTVEDDQGNVDTHTVTVTVPARTFAGNEDQWNYVRNVTVTERSGQTLTDYPVRVEVDTAAMVDAGQLNPDCSDLRFTDADDSTVYDYWIQGQRTGDGYESSCDTNATTVWVAVDELPADAETTVRMHHGNGDATAVSDGPSTFTFFDDFSDGIDGNWTKIEDHGTVSVSNGVVTMDTTGGDYGPIEAGLKSTFTVGPGYTVRAVSRTGTRGRHSALLALSEDDPMSVHNAEVVQPSLTWYGRGDANDVVADAYDGQRYSDVEGYEPDQWSAYGIEYVSGSTAVWYRDGERIRTATDGSYVPGADHDLHVGFGGDGHTPPLTYVSQVIVRESVSPAPTTSVGPVNESE